MRKRSKKSGISVHAIAGTEVVLLGLDATAAASEGLLGFHVSRRKGRSGSFKPLAGEMNFRRSSVKTPIIQAFQWSDYTAEPGTSYTYRVVPVRGKPDAMTRGTPVDVTITTESPDDKTHGIYFNRGVAGSQAYSRWFGEYRKWYLDPGQVDSRGRPRARQFLKPEDVPQQKAYRWLSRGLEEAMLAFLAQAKGPEYSIRAAVYEFTHMPAIQAFVDALERGADVKIVHHAKRESSYLLKMKRGAKVETTTTWADGSKPPTTFKGRYGLKETSRDGVCRAADAAVGKVGVSNPKYLKALDQMMIERTITQISHNKFIVLLKKGKPIQVWTGSTNFTGGGIYGQSNVGHVVRDAGVATKYFNYWKKLSTDPKKKSAANDPPTLGMKNWTVNQQADLDGPPPNAITPVFSPRLTKGMLDWYADRLAAARNSVFFTAAFSVADEIFNNVKDSKPVADGEPYLRYLLLEGKGGLLKDKYPVMAKCPQNRIAYGDTLRRRGDDAEHQQFIETLTGLNDHVNYLHTKYMLIDPLSDDPIVISGSANFSRASTIDNDENMLVIRGNTRVADIFLGEFMRLFNHFQWRNRLNAMSDAKAKQAQSLAPNDSWKEPYYTGGTGQCSERMLFA